MTELAVFDVIGPKSPSARIRKRGAVMRSGGNGLRSYGGRGVGRDGTAGFELADWIAVDLAEEYMADQHHDEGEYGHCDDQPRQPKQLSDEQHPRDGDDRRQVHLALHDHGGHEVGLDEVHAYA